MNSPALNLTDSLAAPVSFRPENSEDEAFLRAVYASTREEELKATGWDAPARAAFLQMQFAAQRRDYQAGFPAASFLIILQGGERAGRMVVHRATDEIRLVDIALLPMFQGRGIGGVVVRELVAEAEKTDKPLRVSVFKPSRAAAFYQRLGFVRTGEAGPYDLWEWRPRPRLNPTG